MSGSMPEDGVQQCLDVVLGENDIGNILRDIYHYPDKHCECMLALGDATPECFISLPEMPIDNAKVPLSLVKKEMCLLEIGCGALDDLCASELKSLDECLPPVDEDSFSCLQVMEQCELLELPPISILAPPELTRSQLPDSCLRVYQDSKSDTNIIERYTHFNDVCNKNVVDEAVHTSAARSYNVDDDSAMSTAKAPIAILATLLVVAGVAAFVVFKKRRTSSQPSPRFDAVIDDEVELI